MLRSTPCHSVFTAPKLRAAFLPTMLLLLLLILLADCRPDLSCSCYAVEFPGSSGVPAPPDSQASFENWLAATGRPVTSRYHGYRAHYPTYRDYHMLVYGRPDQVAGNRYDSLTGQYADLGYSYDERVVTNSLFRDDAPGGVTQSSPWSWIEMNQGEEGRLSWARLSARQKAFISQAGLTYRGNAYGGMTFAGLGLSGDNTVVLTQPSWQLGFALFTNHRLNGTAGEIRYATFNGAGAGDVALRCDLEILTEPAAANRYIIDSQSDRITIEYRISGSITGFSGLADESDIGSRGAGNGLSWVGGAGTGPWTVSQTLEVSRADLDGSDPRQYILSGTAWVVSKMGDIRLQQTEKAILVSALPRNPDFEVTMQIKGGIGYFAGQTNGLGRTLPVDPHRFLALERLWLILDFTRVPQSIAIHFNGVTYNLAGISGVTHYQTYLIIPDWPSTLTWDNIRLSPPLILWVQAAARDNPSHQVDCSIEDIELTGDIYDITFAQPGSS